MKSVLVDFRISQNSENTLKSMGYSIVKTEKRPDLAEPVCGHPDMTVCKLSDNDFVVKTTLCGLFECNIIKGTSELKPEYPFDIAYNAARIGDFLFCNEEYTDKKILEYCKQCGIKVLNVKQGYAKCSICEVSDNAIITADKSIYNAAKENNIDVLLIENKGIILNGYNEGFIGGATGLIEKDLLAVNGNIKLHKNCEEIISFCKNYGIRVISLSDEPITDIGSIIRIY